jgi:hypothetical protein
MGSVQRRSEQRCLGLGAVDGLRPRRVQVSPHRTCARRSRAAQRLPALLGQLTVAAANLLARSTAGSSTLNKPSHR